MRITGKTYNITDVKDFTWSYSEHVVYAREAEMPTIMDGCHSITEIEELRRLDEFPLKDFVWRCEGLCWSFSAEVRRGTTCMERFCWDATFGTSSSEFPFLRIVATDAEFNSVVIATALVTRQSEGCFRLFFRTHVNLMYGRALNMHMIAMSDGDPKLAKVAKEATIVEGRGAHGAAVTLCTYHAMDKMFSEDYDRSHGQFDGGTGRTLVSALRVMLQDSESQDEAKVRKHINYIKSYANQQIRLCTKSNHQRPRQNKYLHDKVFLTTYCT
jgi:hypothetical protein